MARKQFDPAGSATLPHRALESVFTDNSETTIFTPANESLAIRLLARRYGLTARHAALVASLAGLAVNVAPILPALIGAGR